MKKENKKPFVKKNSFFVFVFISLVLLFAIAFFNLQHTYNSARDNVIELSKVSSVQNAENIQQFFLRHEDVLLVTAEQLEYSLINDDLGSKEIRDQLTNISLAYSHNVYSKFTNTEFTGIYAAVDGKLIHAFKTDADLPSDYDPTNRPWYKEGLDGKGKVVFGEPYLDIYSPFMVMTATKVLEDGETVLGMDINLDALQYVGQNLGVSVTLNGQEHVYGYGFVLSENGVVMAHTDASEQGKSYADPQSPMYEIFNQIKLCVENNNDFFESKIDGHTHAIFPHQVENGWYVVTLSDLADIQASISYFTAIVLIGTLGITLFAIIYFVLIIRSSFKEQKLTDSLSQALVLAKKDRLTGYANRTAYDLKVQELKGAMLTSHDQSFAYVIMDINDLKYVNDHYGHIAGDHYIINCCKFVLKIIPTEIYRIGGDEFAMFLTGDEFDHWDALYAKLREALVEANNTLALRVNRPSIAIGVSVHIAGNDDDIEDLLHKADAEMYLNKASIKQAKLNNSQRGESFDDIKKKLFDRQTLASEIQTALEQKQFELWFQPQVNHSRGGNLIGAEALVRWRHPTRGIVSPAVFIPLFEFNGLIYELDKYVWDQACSYIRSWLDQGLKPRPLSVNVSRLDILQPDFIQVITSLIQKYQIPVDLLHLELTESAFMEDSSKIVSIAQELVLHGFTLAIDDFGSGYSSLSMLKNVPAQILKLDMRFFSGRENETRNECIIESIVRMSKKLGMSVLAEGVEQIEQADLLKRLGCNYIQGYLYSKPLCYDDFLNYAKASVKEIQAITRPTSVSSTSSQTLYDKIIKGTNDLIIVAELNTKTLLYANPAAEQYYHNTFDPSLSITCTEFCNHSDLCKNCPVQNLLSGQRKEITYFDSKRHLKFSYSYIDWNGQEAFACYQSDISQQYEEMEFSRSLINNLPAAIVILEEDLHGDYNFIYSSPQAKKLFSRINPNYEITQFQEFLAAIHPDDHQKLSQDIKTSFSKFHKFQDTFRLVLADSTIITINCIINPTKDPNNKSHFYCILTQSL